MYTCTRLVPHIDHCQSSCVRHYSETENSRAQSSLDNRSMWHQYSRRCENNHLDSGWLKEAKITSSDRVTQTHWLRNLVCNVFAHANLFFDVQPSRSTRNEIFVISSHLTYQLFLCRQKGEDCCMELLFEFSCMSSLYTAVLCFRHPAPLSEWKITSWNVVLLANQHFQHLLLCCYVHFPHISKRGLPKHSVNITHWV